MSGWELVAVAAAAQPPDLAAGVLLSAVLQNSSRAVQIGLQALCCQHVNTILTFVTLTTHVADILGVFART